MLHDNSRDALAKLFQSFDGNKTARLLLDYDGTLAPFQLDRFKAYPYPEVVPILERIIRSHGTEVSIISGRPVSEIRALLGPLADLEIWGAHGMEHRSADGAFRRLEIPSDIREGLAQAEEWLAREDLLSMAEIKAGGVAVHWRGLSAKEIANLQQRVEAGWQLFRSTPGLKFLAFEGGMELRSTKPDKGDAIRAILGKADAGTPVAFLGDDVTDEDAFRVLNGHGLSVLVRPEFRETDAALWLQPPVELVDFLNLWHEASS
ncbi:trehalose-phosphatase [Silvibacterium acidisoli]|uniref:trehalose-phosphatase n=1 Tax=Acidobacteriaceae bacterium ZG23-2 TaxID=2883246 RepID=UPI00406C4EA2